MKFRFKNGAILLHRVGPMNAQRQIHDEAPCRRGVYAFVWPYFDLGYVYHQLDEKHTPKRFTDDVVGKVWGEDSEKGKALSLEKDKWLAENKARLKKAMRPKKMWWNKPFYSRIPHSYALDRSQSWYYWTDLREWAKEAMKYTMWTYSDKYFPEDQKFMIGKCGADSFEVVLPM